MITLVLVVIWVVVAAIGLASCAALERQMRLASRGDRPELMPPRAVWGGGRAHPPARLRGAPPGPALEGLAEAPLRLEAQLDGHLVDAPLLVREQLQRAHVADLVHQSAQARALDAGAPLEEVQEQLLKIAGELLRCWQTRHPEG